MRSRVEIPVGLAAWTATEDARLDAIVPTSGVDAIRAITETMEAVPHGDLPGTFLPIAPALSDGLRTFLLHGMKRSRQAPDGARWSDEIEALRCICAHRFIRRVGRTYRPVWDRGRVPDPHVAKALDLLMSLPDHDLLVQVWVECREPVQGRDKSGAPTDQRVDGMSAREASRGERKPWYEVLSGIRGESPEDIKRRAKSARKAWRCLLLSVELDVTPARLIA